MMDRCQYQRDWVARPDNREKKRECLRRYRQKLLTDPERLEQYRQKHKEYERARRKNPEVRAYYREYNKKHYPRKLAEWVRGNGSHERVRHWRTLKEILSIERAYCQEDYQWPYAFGGRDIIATAKEDFGQIINGNKTVFVNRSWRSSEPDLSPYFDEAAKEYGIVWDYELIAKLPKTQEKPKPKLKRQNKYHHLPEDYMPLLLAEKQKYEAAAHGTHMRTEIYADYPSGRRETVAVFNWVT
jgi:hypothetical protein